MDRLQWVFELIDRVSGPANAAASAMGRVQSSMQRASSASDRLGSRQSALRGGVAKATAAVVAFGSRALRSLHPVNVATRIAEGGFAALKLSIRAAGSAISGLGSMAMRLLTSPLSQLAAMVAPFATALAVAKGQLDAIVDRQKMVRGLEMTLGIGEGEGAMRRIVALADQLGVNWNEFGGGIRELLNKGFGEEQAFRLAQGMADLVATNPAASFERLSLALGQIQNTGYLQGDELNQLRDSGLAMAPVYERIAAALDIDPSKVMEAVSQRRVTADILMNSVLGAMGDQAGGVLGSIAEQMSHTLGGEIERLKNAPDRFFERVAAGNDATTQRLTLGVRRLNEFLDPSSANGQKMVAAMGTAIEKVADALEWLTANTEQISSVMNGLGIILTPVKWTLVGMGAILSFVATTVELVSYGIGGLIGWLASANVRMAVTITGWRAQFAAFAGSMYNIGRDVVMGLVQGLVDFMFFPATQITAMGQSMIETLRRVLGIHSPSAEFAYLGQMTSEGFMQGLTDSGMGLALDGTMQAPSMSAPSGSASMMGNTLYLTIQVDARGEDAQGIAESVRDMLLPELSSAFESLAIEVGA